jgi:hypothetical protein
MSTPLGVQAVGAQTTAATTWCNYFSWQYGLYIGPVEAATARQEIRACYDGSTVWDGGYNFCQVTAIPAYFGGSDLCTLIGSGSTSMTARNNFFVAAYPAPWWHRTGYMYFVVNSDGNFGDYSAFCCN